jgi:hypothetical protein
MTHEQCALFLNEVEFALRPSKSRGSKHTRKREQLAHGGCAWFVVVPSLGDTPLLA